MIITWRPRAADDFETLITTSSAGHTAHASRDKSLVETRIQQLVRFDQLGRKTRGELGADTIGARERGLILDSDSVC